MKMGAFLFFLLFIPALICSAESDIRLIAGFQTGIIIPAERFGMETDVIAGIVFKNRLELSLKAGILVSDLFSADVPGQRLPDYGYAGVFSGYRLRLSERFSLTLGGLIGVGNDLEAESAVSGFLIMPEIRFDTHFRLHAGKTIELSVYGKYLYDIRNVGGFGFGIEFHLNASRELKR